MPRPLLARPGPSHTSPRTNSVRPPMPSRPHVLRHPTARAVNAGRLECRWQRDQLPEAIGELVLDDQRQRNDICWSAFDWSAGAGEAPPATVRICRGSAGDSLACSAVTMNLRRVC